MGAVMASQPLLGISAVRLIFLLFNADINDLASKVHTLVVYKCEINSCISCEPKSKFLLSME